MQGLKDLVKRIQINEEGDIILGTPAMVGFLNELAIAEVDPKKLYNISKEGIIIEIKPFPKDMPENLRTIALAFFTNQVSVRGILDHQTFASKLKG